MEKSRDEKGELKAVHHLALVTSHSPTDNQARAQIMPLGIWSWVAWDGIEAPTAGSGGYMYGAYRMEANLVARLESEKHERGAEPLLERVG